MQDMLYFWLASYRLISSSTAEVEYVTLSMAIREIVSAMLLLYELYDSFQINASKKKINFTLVQARITNPHNNDIKSSLIKKRFVLDMNGDYYVC